MNARMFEPGQESAFTEAVQQQGAQRFILLADAHTNGFCLPLLRQLITELETADRIVIPSGETNKTLDTCTLIWSALNRMGAHRRCALVAVGGGMVLDLAGLAAALYKRGLPVWYVPTTLLAMTDAAHGGKTGVDFEGGKNLIGTVRQPAGIYLQPLFLRTLSDRILRSGFAEMIKHALLAGEPLWSRIQRDEPEDLCRMEAIRESIRIKETFVSGDEQDHGRRQCLNLGHTIGHALESASWGGTGEYLHGEAVMLGMEAELRISEDRCGLDPGVRASLQALRKRLFPELRLHLPPESIRPLLTLDKKHDGLLRMSLLRAPGDPVWGIPVDPELALEALQDLC